MRLRPLTEAECYARCYGERSPQRVGVVRLLPHNARRAPVTGEHLRTLFEERLDARARDEEAA